MPSAVNTNTSNKNRRQNVITIVRKIKTKLCAFQRRQVLILFRALGKETTQTMGAQAIVIGLALGQ